MASLKRCVGFIAISFAFLSFILSPSTALPADLPAQGSNVTLIGRRPGLKPGDRTSITLINATPYTWKRIYKGSVDFVIWDEAWPRQVRPKSSVRVDLQEGKSRRASGHVLYNIERTTQPWSFRICFHSDNGEVSPKKMVATMPRANGDEEIVLGYQKAPGGVSWMVAGTEGNFITNGGPANWMQAMLPEIGNFSLRELALPRSHHTGLWKAEHHYGLGTKHNSLTQTMSLREQLEVGGIRVIDLRPVLRKDKFYEGHTHKVGIRHGLLGASVEEMVNTINRFQDEYSGELIIIDIKDRHSMSANSLSFQSLSDDDLQLLYKELKRLKYRARLVNEDITTWPLGHFIGDGESAVIIQIDSIWRNMFDPSEGFIAEEYFPHSSKWSNHHVLDVMVEDQLNLLKSYRWNRTNPIFHLNWFLTQTPLHIMQFWNSDKSIVGLNREAHKALFKELWDVLTDDTYPNWIDIDAVYGNHLKALAMTINKCFAAKRCWQLGPELGITER